MSTARPQRTHDHRKWEELRLAYQAELDRQNAEFSARLEEQRSALTELQAAFRELLRKNSKMGRELRGMVRANAAAIEQLQELWRIDKLEATPSGPPWSGG